MKHTEATRLVEQAYTKLDFLNNKTWTAYRDRCAAMAEGEERQHRKGAPDDYPRPKVSPAFCGRFFAAKRIAEEMIKPRATVADILCYQPSAMYAASIVANYRDEIAQAWEGLNVQQLEALDYCAFLAGTEHKDTES